jgi:hypothetical protein
MVMSITCNLCSLKSKIIISIILILSLVLFAKYNQNDQIKEDEMGRACSTHRGKGVLVGNPEGMRQLGRSRYRQEDNIKMDLEKTGQGGMDSIHLAQDRDQWRALVNIIMNLHVP